MELGPGHYEYDILLDSSSNEAPRNLEVRPLLVSSDADGSTTLISVEGRHPKKPAAPYSLRALSFGGNSSDRFSLYPPDYPFDGGWLPENPSGFRFEIKSTTALTFKALRLRRSKWNTPLIERIGETQSFLPSKTELKEIAVNLQGGADEQLKEVQEARKNWKPSGPVLIILQLAPDEVSNAGLSATATTVLQELKEWSAESPRIRFGVSINPYHNDQHRGEVTRFYDNSAFNSVFGALRPFLIAKAHLVLLRTDDFAPSIGKSVFDYGLSAKKDRQIFKTLARAHLDLVQRVQKLVSQESPSTSLAFVPPWYATSFTHHSPQLASKYLHELTTKLPQSIPIIWTGPVVRSLWIDDASFAEFDPLIHNHPLILWDNTPYARAHKDFWLQDSERLLSCSLFEPYDTPITSKFFSSSVRPFVLLNTGINPINRIQLETAQQYISNTSSYHPEVSLWRVLVSEFGERPALLILEFDRHFWIAYKALKDNNDTLLASSKLELETILNQLRASGSSKLISLQAQLSRIFERSLLQP